MITHKDGLMIVSGKEDLDKYGWDMVDGIPRPDDEYPREVAAKPELWELWLKLKQERSTVDKPTQSS